MKKSNAAKDRLLAKLNVGALSLISLEKEISGHTVFSLRYFDNSQEHGPDFSQLEEGILKKVIDTARLIDIATLQVHT